MLYILIKLFKISQTCLLATIRYDRWFDITKKNAVIPTLFSWFGCIHPQIKLGVCSEGRSYLFHSKSILVVSRAKKNCADVQYLWPDYTSSHCIHLRTYWNCWWIDKGVLSHANFSFDKWCLFCLLFSLHSHCPSAILYSSHELSSTKQTPNTCLWIWN